MSPAAGAIMAVLLLLGPDAGAPTTNAAWLRVGPAGAVTFDPAAGRFDLHVADAATPAGLLSRQRLPLAGRAVLVTVDVTDAPAHGVTLALIDAATGNALDEWQNPLPVINTTRLAAVLAVPVGVDAPEGRVFIGTRDAASAARFANLSAKPTSPAFRVLTASYGAIAGADRHAGQVFKAGATRLDAVRFRVRQLEAGAADGPDLRVAVYAWRDGRGERPLVERLVPRRLIPAPPGNAETELTVPIGIGLTRGGAYLVEFSPAGPAGASESFLLFGGDDRDPRGFRVENGQPTPDRWDLYLETFEAD